MRDRKVSAHNDTYTALDTQNDALLQEIEKNNIADNVKFKEQVIE